MTGRARFSADRRFRYELWRLWDASRPICAFVLLNPSSADERADDPTVRRCVGFARRWGFGGIVVVNLFAFRARDPRALRAAADAVGPANDAAILRCASRAGLVVLGWGARGSLYQRSRDVRALLASVRPNCRRLGATAAGEPRHPLYVRRAAKARSFAG